MTTTTGRPRTENEKWLDALGCAAHVAGDDPERCLALAPMVRILTDTLKAQRLEAELAHD